MPYSYRITAAAVLSVLLHLLALWAWVFRSPADTLGPLPPVAENMVVRLQPEPPPQRQLVDIAEPAEDAPEPTDNIAEQNARASDAELAQGENLGPRPDMEADAEVVGAPALPAEAAPQSAAPPSAPALEAMSPQAEDTPEATPEPPPVQTARALPLPRPARPGKPQPESPEANPSETTPREAVAKAAPAPPRPPRKSRGKLDNQVNQKGFAGYEALQDELAPYLREVQLRVERRWNEALMTRYQGSSKVRAEVDCVITPDGKVTATIVDDGGNRLYGALCKNAIEQAGPFPPFPFDVPDIYRSQSLEIRWTFSFL